MKTNLKQNYKEIYRVEKITTVRDNKPDDIFICASSFEERCRQASSKLSSSNYKTLYSIMFNYSGGERQTLRLFNSTKIIEHLSKVTLNQPVVQINCERIDPLHGIEKLEIELSKLKINLSELTITIDISTFTKQYLFVLMQKVESLLKPKFIRLLYTEPSHYGRGEFQRLTYGVKNVVIIPGFIGKNVEEAKILLVVFLGYELHRTLAVIEKYVPDLLIAVIGKPPYYKGWDDFSIKTHEHLLAKPDVLTYEMPAREPNIVKEGLINIWNNYSKDFENIYISPTGTKLQAIGIYEFVRQYPLSRVVYAIPEGYHENYYSISHGETWEYYLTLL